MADPGKGRLSVQPAPAVRGKLRVRLPPLAVQLQRQPQSRAGFRRPPQTLLPVQRAVDVRKKRLKRLIAAPLRKHRVAAPALGLGGLHQRPLHLRRRAERLALVVLAPQPLHRPRNPPSPLIPAHVKERPRPLFQPVGRQRVVRHVDHLRRRHPAAGRRGLHRAEPRQVHRAVRRVTVRPHILLHPSPRDQVQRALRRPGPGASDLVVVVLDHRHERHPRRQRPGHLGAAVVHRDHQVWRQPIGLLLQGVHPQLVVGMPLGHPHHLTAKLFKRLGQLARRPPHHLGKPAGHHQHPRAPPGPQPRDLRRQILRGRQHRKAVRPPLVVRRLRLSVPLQDAPHVLHQPARAVHPGRDGAGHRRRQVAPHRPPPRRPGKPREPRRLQRPFGPPPIGHHQRRTQQLIVGLHDPHRPGLAKTARQLPAELLQQPHTRRPDQGDRQAR